MTTQIASRRADTGLPDVANGWAFIEEGARAGIGFYFDDGFTWEEFAGAQLAGKPPFDKRGDPFREGPESRVIKRSAGGGTSVRRLEGPKPSFTVSSSKNGL